MLKKIEILLHEKKDGKELELEDGDEERCEGAGREVWF